MLGDGSGEALMLAWRTLTSASGAPGTTLKRRSLSHPGRLSESAVNNPAVFAGPGPSVYRLTAFLNTVSGCQVGCNWVC